MQIATPQTAGAVGGHVEIRRLEVADREALAEEFAHLSEQTRWRRFGTVAGHLSERDLDRLTNIDHHAHEALAAIAPHSKQIVGVARYIALPTDPGTAEVAIEVDDDWQGQGIGRQLMSELTERARTEGISRLVAYVNRDNHPVTSWIARSGGTVEAHADDATVYSIPLDSFADERKAA
jgi:GNAT superfamily N-acetyltransferase